MSHTAQAVTTGVLLFDGEPRVTQGLRAWLRPFLLSDDVLDQSETQLGRPGLGLQFPAQTLHVELDTLEEGLLWEGARLRPKSTACSSCPRTRPRERPHPLACCVPAAWTTAR